MTAHAAATLVWLAPAAEPQAAAPVADAAGDPQRTIAHWARAHGEALEPPADVRVPQLAPDPAAAERIEQLLDRSRDSLSARDAAGADGALDAAGALLRAHPELPQAAWLMAEVERGRATRWRRIAPGDAEAADRAWARAEAIDGGRVGAVSETAGAQGAAAALVTLDLPADEGAWWDGARVEGPAVRTRAGSHALVVTWDGGPIAASWVDVPAGPSRVRPEAPPALACALADVRRAHLEGGAVSARGVRCPRWVAATPVPGGAGVLVATCEADRCSALVDWTPSPPWTWPLPERPRPAWPSWATWTLVTAGVAAAVGAGVVAAVVAAEPSPSETRFVTGGLRSR